MAWLPVIMLSSQLISLATSTTSWSTGNLPDLRNPFSCGVSHEYQFICDPDRVLTTTQNEKLNDKLFALATNKTACRCERRSECTMEDSKGSKKVHVGFMVVVAVATDIARNTTTSKHGVVISQTGQRFCRYIQSHWSLGNCGNTVVILLWVKERMVFLQPGIGKSVVKLLTEERISIVKGRVSDFVESAHFFGALEELADLLTEVLITPDSSVNVGIVIMMVSIGVLVALLCIITGCVCAFRCCGQLNPPPESRLGRTFVRIDSFRADLVRRGTLIRRSLSIPRTPKVSTAQPAYQTVTYEAQMLDSH